VGRSSLSRSPNVRGSSHDCLGQGTDHAGHHQAHRLPPCVRRASNKRPPSHGAVGLTRSFWSSLRASTTVCVRPRPRNFSIAPRTEIPSPRSWAHSSHSSTQQRRRCPLGIIVPGGDPALLQPTFRGSRGSSKATPVLPFATRIHWLGHSDDASTMARASSFPVLFTCANVHPAGLTLIRRLPLRRLGSMCARWLWTVPRGADRKRMDSVKAPCCA